VFDAGNRSHVAEKNGSIFGSLTSNEFGDSGQTKRMGLMAGHNSIQRSPVSLYEKKFVSYPQLTTQQSPLLYASKSEEYKDI